MLDNGRRKVNQLHSAISNRDINLNAHRLLLLAVVRPTLEYGSEVWEANKTQAAALEAVMLGGAKHIILGCSSKICNEAVILDVWEQRMVRLYGDNPRVQQIASGELQGVTGRGELRCLGGETDTSCSYCSGCVVYGPSAMAAT